MLEASLRFSESLTPTPVDPDAGGQATMIAPLAFSRHKALIGPFCTDVRDNNISPVDLDYNPDGAPTPTGDYNSVGLQSDNYITTTSR